MQDSNKPHVSEGWNLPVWNCRRRNYVGSAHVNAALKIQELYDSQRAIKLLHEKGLPDTVINRVLENGALVRTHKSV